MMQQKAVRTAAAKAFKARKVPLRKGAWRLRHDELTWFVSLRSSGPQPEADLVFEVGCWVHDLVPEPEGGAVDCPLLLDVPLAVEDRTSAGEVGAAVDRLLDRLDAVPDPAALAAAWRDGDWGDAYVDVVLAEHLRGLAP
ncbi:hypothetical protein [Nocardioides insulae]|uniref:hypothetical protein n=1 Tax=Nocardioides insulae TaxID=394734 RepID=UPI0003FB8054|nr:hypothetical protein [Nocardioides insulae]